MHKYQFDNLEKYLRNLYRDIEPEKNAFKDYYDPMEQKFLDEFIDDPLQIKIHNFHKNRIEKLTIDEGYPVEWKNEDGKTIFVQLRKIDKNKLLLGCGNNPTSICYNYPIDKDFEKECHSFFCYEEWAKCIIRQTYNDLSKGDYHLHGDYITIDPNITMNPTIVGFFGWYKIPEDLIPSNSLIDIHSEGIILNGLKNYESEYLRLTGKSKVFYKDIAYEK
tara:strand:+ start:372 stop:1031 length:660 start_codon:yes stop_codon:yes gene_type:complete